MLRNRDTFCFRCFHTWKKRRETPPKVCPNPKCKSPYWNKPRKRIQKEVVEQMEKMIIGIHNGIILISGGEHGVRESGGIYNSTYKLLNHQYKNKKDPISIGTFALNEFARRHYFVDGNKRTAYAIAKIFMLINGCHLKTKYREATHFIIKIAEYGSKITYEQIHSWLVENCEPIMEKDIETYLNKTFVNLMLGD